VVSFPIPFVVSLSNHAMSLDRLGTNGVLSMPLMVTHPILYVARPLIPFVVSLSIPFVVSLSNHAMSLDKLGTNGIIWLRS